MSNLSGDPTRGFLKLLLQCDVLMRAAESGKGRAPPEPMKFTVARDHACVAGRALARGSGSRAILLKYLVEPRLDGPVVWSAT
jgi:hypothetical protein